MQLSRLGLRDRWAIAGEGGAAHVARLLGGERAAAVHGLAVVPHHQIADRPFMRVDELALGGVLDQVAQEGARLGDPPADDGPGMRSQDSDLRPVTGWVRTSTWRTGLKRSRSSSLRSKKPICCRE
jgi:hypothetical protein